MIIHYRRKFGFTAVLISHDIPDVFFISDRIVILWEGAVGFEGTYEEAVRLKLPMIDEFLRSLEGFQDELTGLLSREAFRVHYAAMLGGSAGISTVSAALFSVEFDLLHESPGTAGSRGNPQGPWRIREQAFQTRRRLLRPSQQGSRS